MSKTNKIFNIITLSVILICSIGVVGTFLSDYLVSINWFGDVYYTDGSVSWGARHYWYNWGCFLLVFVSFFRTITVCVNISEEKK